MSYWTIQNNAAINPNGNPLNGLLIQSNSSGYQLVNPNATGPNPAILATTTKTAAPFEFKDVQFSNQVWNIHVKNPLIDGQNSTETWHLHGPKRDGQDGSYTAQAGSSLGEEPDEVSSSAKA